MSAKCCHRIAIEGVRSVARKVIIATVLETCSKLFEWLQAPQHFPILVHPPNSNVKFFRMKVNKQCQWKTASNQRTWQVCKDSLMMWLALKRDVANRRSQVYLIRAATNLWD
jgi:hypothetical protein